jgi:ABC-type transport system substrate-binding protein
VARFSAAVDTCHVPPRDMRQHPVGTGPFKFVGFKPNEYIKLARNPSYWKKDRPLLDGIEYTIIKNLSTAVLAFVAGKFDAAFPYSLTVPLLKDVKSQMPSGFTIGFMAPAPRLAETLPIYRGLLQFPSPAFGPGLRQPSFR